jgi:3-deoxy-manno-octulosonate cytidylyltransferase (CMP-KDO synthetase)
VKTLCVIPCRYESTRFPGKALALIEGKTLIHHVVERVLGAHEVDQFIVATDHEKIEQAVKRIGKGVRVERTRTDHPSGTDRISEVAEREEADVIVNVQGDEPLIDASLIDRLVKLFKEDSHLKMATAKVRITNPEDIQDPNCVKVVTGEQGYALYFSRAPIPYVRRNGIGRKEGVARSSAVYYKHLGIYAYRRKFLLQYAKWPVSMLEHEEKLEQLRALDHGVRIRVIETDHDSIGVDTPQDIERVRKRL